MENKKVIRNGNKLLNNFIGGDNKKSLDNYDSLDLLGIVDKIESLIPNNNNVKRFMVNIRGTSCVVLDMYDNQNDFLNLYYEKYDSKIEAIWHCCVKFINWLNHERIDFN